MSSNSKFHVRRFIGSGISIGLFITVLRLKVIVFLSQYLFMKNFNRRSKHLSSPYPILILSLSSRMQYPFRYPMARVWLRVVNPFDYTFLVCSEAVFSPR